MAVLTSRILAKPTITGRSRALATKGNGRFARFANLTGTEALDKGNRLLKKLQNKVETSCHRLAIEFSNIFDNFSPAPVVNLSGIGSRPLDEVLEEVQSFNNSFSSKIMDQSGNAHLPKKSLLTSEEEDFRNFIDLVNKNRKFIIAYSLTVVGTLTIGGLFVLYMMMDSITSDPQPTPTEVLRKSLGGMLIVGALTLVERAIFQRYFAPYKKSLNSIADKLVSRFKNSGVPKAFKDIDPSAAKKLEFLIQYHRENSYTPQF